MITSTAHGHVKAIRSLVAHRQERSRERCLVLEGVRLVAEALAAGVPLRLVLYAPEQLETTETGQRLLAQLATLPESHEATARVVSAAADTVTPQGVVAIAPWPDLPPASPRWLVLDEVQDPGNVGTLLRSAEAAGIGQVVCSQGTADVYSPKVVRAAMGAHFFVSLRSSQSWEEIRETLQGVLHIYAADAGGKTPYDVVDWQQPVALIIGNEAQGIGPEGHSLATRRITIPMQGRIASLNAAVAGSVLLFEMLRQSRTAGRASHQ
ncbi:MAG: RNA methyltransferase [Chloroflexaceae bacterium]|nr:RNA methyltransferase [Chloroflexaceae bacterium]